MQNQPPSATFTDDLGFTLPTPEAGLAEARKRLAHTFRQGELVWLVDEHYDKTTPAWNIDVMRQGAAARWVRQRFRFDEQAEILYYLGETALSDSDFRTIKAQKPRFPQG